MNQQLHKIKKKNTNKAKHHLNSIRDIQDNIRCLEEQIEELDTKLQGGAIQYGDKIQCSSSGKENLLCKLVDLKSDLYNMVYDKKKEIIEFNKIISKINNNKYEYVLRERYIRERHWSEIAHTKKCSVSTIHNWHREALIKYQEIIEKDMIN